MNGDQMLKLGLIGDNIAASSSPTLHRLAGAQAGMDVSYERLVPQEQGLPFDVLLADCASSGYRGVNVTYPYKERAAALVEIGDPRVRAMGAVNTVVFDQGRARGFNTDYSGFMAAYRAVMASPPSGPVLLIGTGGVGRAVAFGLAQLGAPALRLVDRDPQRSEALAEALIKVAPDMSLSTVQTAEEAASGVTGLVNCTPLGMVGYDGTPLAAEAMQGAEWAFDAVYTPRETQFLRDAKSAGLRVISGWELFFYQGLHAWQLFSGTEADEAGLRHSLHLTEGAA